MPLHHYLPASFLGRFSADLQTEPARDRSLIVGDKKNQRRFEARASKVGCINNLYTLVDDSQLHPNTIDQTWGEYERNLPVAIDKLIHRNVDAESWARVLVPFVACMLVRGPDFSERFDQRWPPNRPQRFSELLSKDNANRARLMDLQRLLGFVATAKWLVLTIHGEEQLITNDLGYAPFMNREEGDRGMAIPVSQNTILAIIPTIESHPILRAESDKWIPIIDYLDEPLDSHQGLNRALSQAALRFIFGPDPVIVQKYIQGSPLSRTSPEANDLGFPDSMFSRAFEFTWHRLVGTIRKPPSDKKGWDFPLDWKVIADGWHSVPWFPLNLAEFPPPLKKVGNTIQTTFYNPEIYYSISIILMLEKVGQHEDAIKEASNALLNNQLSPSVRARILALRGNALAETGRHRDAIKDFKDAITLDHFNADIYFAYATYLLENNNLGKALKPLSKAIKLNPNFGVAYSNRSVVNWKIGHYSNALKDATTAISLLSDDSEKAGAFLNRAKILNDMGMEDKAKEDFIEWERLFKKSSK
ncbi:MAG: DUF4238 domain-containing protein [Chloroflexi bacterium]|nr:DUF4238 domain-containing protein [Chloroflexota bacterium]